MIILGLGSNLGDRLAHLRTALEMIKKIPGLSVQQVSPLYLSDALLPDKAPADWDLPYINLALRCTCSQKPLELLQELKRIEGQLGRSQKTASWGPRTLDIDILAWDDLSLESKVLTLPHPHLLERPFALWPLADIAASWKFPLPGSYQDQTAAELVEKWGSRFSGLGPLRVKQIYQRIDTPRLVGVLNVTPDSFSDGGTFLDVEKALVHALNLVNAGAEVIDIGAESTAPNSNRLDQDTEWQRLLPILQALKDAQTDFLIAPKISVDTRHAETARKALNFGLDWINDVTGLEDPIMRQIMAETDKDCVVMHHTSIPASRNHIVPRNQDIVKLIYEWGMRHLDRLEQAGIARDRIIFDPGIGFGKAPEHSLELIRNVNAFEGLGTRVLIGHSRKSFLSLFTPYPSSERDIETLAISLYLAKQRVDYLRVHQVEMCARGLRVSSAC